tara:strand:+ start:382 stop:798 length:417 start_codon:yes stop_codon:yes gene_type:complete
MTTKKTTTTRKAASATKATPKKAPATKAASKPRASKSAKAAPAAKPKVDAKPKAKTAIATKSKRTSALDAAAKILAEAGEPLNTKQMIEAMAEKGYWTSPGGKTPHATLYSAILREINGKGSESRFVKSERGKFARAS